MFEVINAENPRFVESDQSVIVLNVQFSHLPDPVEFAASAHDTEMHGRDIHARALAGEFGPVAEYVPPTPAEIAARDNPPLRRKQMKLAAEQATHWDMMGDAAQAAAWRGYYRELYAMSESPEWPMIELWPTPPDGLG